MDTFAFINLDYRNHTQGSSPAFYFAHFAVYTICYFVNNPFKMTNKENIWSGVVGHNINYFVVVIIIIKEGN